MHSYISLDKNQLDTNIYITTRPITSRVSVMVSSTLLIGQCRNQYFNSFSLSQWECVFLPVLVLPRRSLSLSIPRSSEPDLRCWGGFWLPRSGRAWRNDRNQIWRTLKFSTWSQQKGPGRRNAFHLHIRIISHSHHTYQHSTTINITHKYY